MVMPDISASANNNRLVITKHHQVAQQVIQCYNLVDK